MKKRVLISIFMAVFVVCTVYAQQLQPLAKIENSQWSFEKNEGQLKDLAGHKMDDVLYFGMDKSVQVYCYKDRVSFAFIKYEPEIKESNGDISNEATVTAHRIDMILVGAQKSAPIIADDKESEFKNYYLQDLVLENLPLYRKLIYHDIYPQIDFVLLAGPGGVKYEFVVKPGGNIASIKLAWQGLDGAPKVENNAMKYSCSLGYLRENKPKTYCFGDEKEITSEFNLERGSVGFLK
jgi:hypothetical protein